MVNYLLLGHAIDLSHGNLLFLDVLFILALRDFFFSSRLIFYSMFGGLLSDY